MNYKYDEVSDLAATFDAKLGEILDDALATAYCAGQDWSKANSTTHKVDAAANEAHSAIKALVVEAT